MVLGFQPFQPSTLIHAFFVLLCRVERIILCLRLFRSVKSLNPWRILQFKQYAAIFSIAVCEGVIKYELPNNNNS